MPNSVVEGTCLERVPGLRDTLLNLQPGVSAGFGALRHEHLRCAAQHWEEGEEEQLEQFSLAYLNGKLPPWLYKVWGSVSSARVPPPPPVQLELLLHPRPFLAGGPPARQSPPPLRFHLTQASLVLEVEKWLGLQQADLQGHTSTLAA